MSLTPSEHATLTDCDREPIQIPGSIQPHGVLLTLDETDLSVLQVSQNIGEMLGVEVDAIRNRPVEDLVGPVLARSLRVLVENQSLTRIPLFLAKGPIPAAPELGPFDLIVHRNDGLLVLELEPALADGLAAFRDLYPLARTFLTTLDKATTVGEVCRMAAAEVRRITGFDRVLIYRFDEDWNGTVIAEDRNSILPSYLDLRFPASDIPAQARALYRDNRVRLIADARYTPIPIVPAANPKTGQPLDLSFAGLRSVSPVHLTYMINMGTGASMSISILRDGELWGLIACHHKRARVVPYEARTAVDFLGQVLSVQIAAKQQRENDQLRIARKAVQVHLLSGMTLVDDFVEGLVEHKAKLLELVDAPGVAILHQGRCTLLGETPEAQNVQEIAGWLDQERRDEVFATDSLPRLFPPAESSKDTACGMLAIATSKIHRSYILWFRPEVVRTVSWSGDPTKVVESGQIHPRKSFEAWKEVVHLRSKPWHPSELEVANELRDAIVGIVLRQAEERAQLSAELERTNKELERSNKELEAFSYSVSHDLRAPFRHISGFAEMLGEQEGDRLSDEGRRYLATILESAQYAGTLVDNLLAFARMGRTELHSVVIDLNMVTRDAVREAMLEAGDRSITWKIDDLPTIEGDLMMIRLVMGNLTSNAVKYTRNRAEAVIEISAVATTEEIVVSVKDNGIGFDRKYANKLFGVFQRLHRMEDFEGTGIGLANVRRIMSRHGGRTWADGEPDQGATFWFAIPRFDLESVKREKFDSIEKS